MLRLRFFSREPGCGPWALAWLALLASPLACAPGAARTQEAALSESFAPCPESPNCVSSLAAAADPTHYIAPFELRVPPDQGWTAAVAALAALPRSELLEQRPGYVHAVVRTRLLRFRDDVELRLDAQHRRVDVRSASRLGSSDLGVNRTRVEQLREALRVQKIVQ